MQREFRESAVKVLRFPRVYRARVYRRTPLKCILVCVPMASALDETRDRDRENRFDTVLAGSAGVIRYR